MFNKLENLELKPAKIIAETTHRVQCPSCGKPAGSIDHLKGQDVQTMWYCEHCGVHYALDLNADGTARTAATNERVDNVIVALKHGDVVLLVKGMHFRTTDATAVNKPVYDEHDRYYYNDHTCPTNYLPHVLVVADTNKEALLALNRQSIDVDPHGIFEYVATLPWDDRVEECNEDDVKVALVEQALKLKETTA